MKKFLFFAIILFVFNYSNAQKISTVAGNGSQGYGGDGGQATLASLYNPAGLAVDSVGNIYIADYDNNVLRKVTYSTGDISTIAGNGTAGYSGDGGLATAAELWGLYGVALDKAGNIYIADGHNDVIREISKSTGFISTIAGNGTAGYSGDGSAATSAELNGPTGIAFDASGNIYICDDGNNVIREVNTSTGVISTISGNGTAGYSGDGGAATSAELNSPHGITLDPSGNIYIGDANNNVVRKVTKASGIISTIAGNGTAGYTGDGAAATSAELSAPGKIALDKTGNMYIADANNNVIRLVTTATGLISTVAGNGTASFSGDGGPATIAELDFTTDVVLDASDNIYIADQFNNRIREVSSLALGVESIITKDNTSVYPNPVTSIINIETGGQKFKEIIITDMLGRQVYDQPYNNQIDLSDLRSGVYILILKDNIGNFYRNKIVKQ
jgi:sugar lactone lactonase YvrE